VSRSAAAAAGTDAAVRSSQPSAVSTSADDAIQQQQRPEQQQQQAQEAHSEQQQKHEEQQTALPEATKEALRAAAAAMLRVLARGASKGDDLQTAGVGGKEQLQYTCRALVALMESGLDFDHIIWHASLTVRQQLCRSNRSCRLQTCHDP
jgi:hypothetical protein